MCRVNKTNQTYEVTNKTLPHKQFYRISRLTSLLLVRHINYSTS